MSEILNKEKLHPEKHFTKRGFAIKWVKNPDQPGITKLHSKGEEESMKGFHESMKKYNLTKLPAFDIPVDKIKVNLEGDINSHAVLVWNDKAGRSQRAYTQEFEKRNAEKKWQMAAKFNKDIIDLIKKKSKNIVVSDDEKIAQAGAIINIIANTGLRVGSMSGYKFTENRGVSTLYPSDIEVKGDTIYFDFKGKSHKRNTSSIKDKVLAKYIEELKEKNKDEKFLFNKVDRSFVDSVFKKKLKFKFKLKDMRTYTACATAKDILFKDFEEIKEIVEGLEDVKKKKRVVLKKINEVCKAVAEVLNNTPAMARKSYIAPQIFDDYIMRLSLEPEDFKKAVEEGEIKNNEEEISLDDIIKDFPPIDREINIDPEDEEFNEEYPLPDWITEEDYKILFR